MKKPSDWWARHYFFCGWALLSTNIGPTRGSLERQVVVFFFDWFDSQLIVWFSQPSRYFFSLRTLLSEPFQTGSLGGGERPAAFSGLLHLVPSLKNPLAPLFGG